jgi:Na+-driven multidrug efflux pump
MQSFGLGLLVMCASDYLLIPSFGITGAAIGAFVAPAVGTTYCLYYYHRSEFWALPLRVLVPRPSDFRAFVEESLQLLPLRRPRGDA